MSHMWGSQDAVIPDATLSLSKVPYLTLPYLKSILQSHDLITVIKVASKKYGPYARTNRTTTFMP